MAVYKVPQDVEAEDKLIGPFSFRQFIYLIVAALGILLAWALSRLFIGLAIVPLPIILAFLALALPLRKDQPMETYLVALIKFYFKPRSRLWDPEGQLSLVNITATKTAEGPQLKALRGAAASQQLAYLAQVVDTQGWASRGATQNQNLSDLIVAEADQAEDVLDANSGVAQALDQRIAQSDDARREALREQMQATNTPSQPSPAQTIFAAPEPTPQSSLPTENVSFSPYPSNMHQRVLSPDGKLTQGQASNKNSQSAVAEENKPSETPGAMAVSPDIMRLANNNDLSISAIAREAQRLSEDDQEVVITLR